MDTRNPVTKPAADAAPRAANRNLPHAPSELDQYVALSGESSNIDAKGPLRWDGGAVSAGLAKDIAAFANSRDGGVLVIGKGEADSGAFELIGLTKEEAGSFDTTTVAQWVNNRFAPPISLVCHHHVYQGRRFVIITVAEFGDVPILCVKSFQDPDDPRKHILRERTVYVRNSQAESAPLATVEDMRVLVGLATSKRRNEMLMMFDSLLKGKPLLGLPTDDQQFDAELNDIEHELGKAHADQLMAGAWWLLIRPGRFDAARWDDMETLESIIKNRAVQLLNTFPPSRNGTHVREWGICNDHYGETWTLAHSGQFLSIRPYWENRTKYKSPWMPRDAEVDAGKWLDFYPSLRSIFDMMLFAARLSEDYEPGEQIRLVLRATDLAGRRLVSSTPTISWEPSNECRTTRFEFRTVLSVEEFRAEWEALCAEAMGRFVEYFPGSTVSLYGSRLTLALGCHRQ